MNQFPNYKEFRQIDGSGELMNEKKEEKDIDELIKSTKQDDLKTEYYQYILYYSKLKKESKTNRYLQQFVIALDPLIFWTQTLQKWLKEESDFHKKLYYFLNDCLMKSIDYKKFEHFVKPIQVNVQQTDIELKQSILQYLYRNQMEYQQEISLFEEKAFRFISKSYLIWKESLYYFKFWNLYMDMSMFGYEHENKPILVFIYRHLTVEFCLSLPEVCQKRLLFGNQYQTLFFFIQSKLQEFREKIHTLKLVEKIYETKIYFG